MFTLTHIAETGSTNRWLREHSSDGTDQAVWADYQTAGRGCGTNTWESKRGENLLFSLLWHPHELKAQDQFAISMAASLALCDVLAKHVLEGLAIKWPNDIYWHDKKLCGMLIENQVRGSNISATIIGIGLNVNQQHFQGDAPNPVSLRHIAGHPLDREELLGRLLDHLSASLERTTPENMLPALHDRYQRHLYRRGAVHPFVLPDGQRHDCLLDCVDRHGRLHLSWDEPHNNDGDRHAPQRHHGAFDFKEVKFII